MKTKILQTQIIKTDSSNTRFDLNYWTYTTGTVEIFVSISVMKDSKIEDHIHLHVPTIEAGRVIMASMALVSSVN